MSLRRNAILEQIAQERARQESLPGSEFDLKHTQNDWVAITNIYLSRAASRKHIPVSKQEFNDNLIKAAAIILAALEHNS